MPPKRLCQAKCPDWSGKSGAWLTAAPEQLLKNPVLS
jgi:hypothetical protein